MEMTGLELLEVSLHWKLQSSCLMLLLFTLPCHLSLMITTKRQRPSRWLTSTCSFLPGTDPLLVGLPPAPLLLHDRRRSHPLRQGGTPGFPVLLISSFSVLSKSQWLSRMSKSLCDQQRCPKNFTCMSNMVDWILQEPGIGAQLMELLNGLVFVNFSTIQHH